MEWEDVRNTPRRYWNTNGMQIAIVAVVSPSGFDWSAYIGATKGARREEETVAWAVENGAKISRKLAEFLFPGVARRGLPYRE